MKKIEKENNSFPIAAIVVFENLNDRKNITACISSNAASRLLLIDAALIEKKYMELKREARAHEHLQSDNVDEEHPIFSKKDVGVA
jgi:hypothetical protein